MGIVWCSDLRLWVGGSLSFGRSNCLRRLICPSDVHLSFGRLNCPVDVVQFTYGIHNERSAATNERSEATNEPTTKSSRNTLRKKLCE